MKSLQNYIIESGASDKETRLAEKIKKHQEKIDKLITVIAKKNEAYDKLIEKYKNDVEVNSIIPIEIFNNFKYITYRQQQDLTKQLGRRVLFMPYNIACGDMYKEKQAEIYLRHGIDNDTKYDGNEDKYKSLDDDPEIKIMHKLYWDYMCKAEDIIEAIGRKEEDLKALQEKVVSVSNQIGVYKEKSKRISDLFEQVPQLAEFINQIGEKQYDFLIDKNEKLKTEWDEYNAKLDELNKQYGSEWGARTNKDKDNGEGYIKYQELKKLQPKHVVLTPEQIRKDIERWKTSERNLLAERIIAEFGEVKSTSLNIGVDGNVNGVINGSLKSARIETIFAGGYNIQCLHTRLLVHEF